MIKLKTLLFEDLSNNLERFREPLRIYMQKTFPREYDQKQLLMFGLSMNNLINVFLNKVLSTKIDYEYTDDEKLMPYGNYDIEKDEIMIGQVNYIRYSSDRTKKYATYVDSVIYHELVHVVNYHKKLFNRTTYDALILGDKYYGDPEEVRAYTSQLKDFLVGHIGFSEKQAERIMNAYSTDLSQTRKQWISKYRHGLKEIEEDDIFVVVYDRRDGHILGTYEEWEYIQSDGHHEKFLKAKDLQAVYEKTAGMFFPKAPKTPTGGLIFWPIEDGYNISLKNTVLKNYKKIASGH